MLLTITHIHIHYIIHNVGDSTFGIHPNKNRESERSKERGSDRGSNYTWLESVGLGTTFTTTNISIFKYL